MTQPPAAAPGQPAPPEAREALDDFERDLLAKVRVLRRAKKRCILIVDGSRVFVFRAEPEGTFALP